MDRLRGKVALITGAARGQGRAHAVRLAQEGADIIAVDLCAQLPSVSYPMSRPEDLRETVAQVDALDRRIVAQQADVRDLADLRRAVEEGVELLGGLDIVCANAGVFCLHPEPQPADPAVRAGIWRDTLDVNLTGVFHTLEATLPVMVEQGRGGAVVITSSSGGLKGATRDDVGLAAYVASKHALTGMMRGYAKDYAAHSIRVNTVHPTAVATPMIQNELLAGRLVADPELSSITANALPVGVIDPVDVSEAVLYLAADSGRFVTGATMRVDAGSYVRAAG